MIISEDRHIFSVSRKSEYPYNSEHPVVHTTIPHEHVYGRCGGGGTAIARFLTQLLTNLSAKPISQISQWLADEWKRRNPALSG
jgi:hypothetical protein